MIAPKTAVRVLIDVSRRSRAERRYKTLRGRVQRVDGPTVIIELQQRNDCRYEFAHVPMDQEGISWCRDEPRHVAALRTYVALAP